LAIQFAAHEGVLRRKDLIKTLRSLAAFETGLTPEDIRDGKRPARATSPAPTPPTVDTLGSQPLTANDDVAVRALLARLADAQVRQDVAAWLTCFSANAIIDGGDGSSESGYDALRGFFSRRFATERWTVTGLDIAVFAYGSTTSAASGRLTITERFGRRNGSTGSRVVVLHDDYERSPGGWLIAGRRYQLLD
jgi:hypothetical protein